MFDVRLFFQTEEGMRGIFFFKFLCHFKIKMLSGVISSLQNWLANYNVAQSDSDKLFLGENTSFALTFNRIALIMYWKFLKLKKWQEKRQLFLFVLWKIVLKPRCALTSKTEIYCLGLTLKLPLICFNHCVISNFTTRSTV